MSTDLDDVTDLALDEGPDDELRDDLADDLDDDLAPEESLAASVSLFEGDEGELEHGQRHALITLLKQRFISARTHPRDWQVLVAHERLLRSRLNDLFLELQVDRVREVAWKRQAVPETGPRFPTLLHDTAWTREETLVLVHLRDRLRAGLAGGDTRVYVDRDDLLDHVASFRPTHATDESGDEKRARNAVAAVQKAGLLIPTASEERFEVSEAVESLLPLELLVELLAALREANGREPIPAEPDADLFEEPGEPADRTEPTDGEEA